MPVGEVEGNGIALVRSLDEFIAREVERNHGSTAAVKPAHRVKFNWPPHPVSYSYHVLASDWSANAQFVAQGETFDVEVAATPYGVFGRCNALWLESRGADVDEMLVEMAKGAEPLFQRQFLTNRCREKQGRFSGHLRDLPTDDLVKLLYCQDRDIANDVRLEIETHADVHQFTAALIYCLRDQRHPHRRSAQWCVLDLFEDLPTFCQSAAEEEGAVQAMKDLIWNAEDDYARTIYKAGVVLGGHIPHKQGGPVLLECLKAPSKIGRRSAIHGLFHVVEWLPTMREEVLRALEETAQTESEPALAEFAKLMARDIQEGEYDHIPEPVFPEEL